MAEKPVATPSDPPKAAKPAEPPKPVHIGGESLVDRILPHLKKIVIGTLVLAGVLLVIFGVRWFQERKAISGTAKLEVVMEAANRPVRAKDQPADPKQPSYGDVKERAASVLNTMARHEATVPGHAFRAGLLLDAGKIDDAIAEYRAGIASPAIEGVLCREGLGLALEAKAAAEKDAAARQKGYEEALAAFVAVQPDENGPRRAYALYHQARMQLLLGKTAEAKALFEKAKEANKESDRELVDLVEKRLATLGAS
jgi:tetratricopeptide (TPR) repeat protein